MIPTSFLSSKVHSLGEVAKDSHKTYKEITVGDCILECSKSAESTLLGQRGLNSSNGASEGHSCPSRHDRESLDKE